ncbi:glycosyltransferase [Micromonospora sp. KC606]|uniref:glycosyltransferase family 4 protein n=1 Tax=Micromonospora sp. KC606 TaxID=2530379 RepID=UPI00104E3D77|nr:glycosyltransferase family 4 protein [Micromonospora sp. KC606]TDC85519.1 glycosyltransferase [Micromonospora sp. KC606]
MSIDGHGGICMASGSYRGTRLLLFQVRPLLAEVAQDGSQAVLVDVLRYFSRLGVRVTVYCGTLPGAPTELDLFPGVTVRPVLGFNNGVGDPYWTPPFRLTDMVDVLLDEAKRHDLLYVHDLNLRFDFVRADRPLVGGVYDFVYPHTLAGTIAFNGDRLVTNSDYVGACVRETLRRHRSLPDDAIRVVNTGFDTARYRPGAGAMGERLGLAPDVVAVLFPHRPEESKGLPDTIRVLAALRDRLSPDVFARVRLLVPVWPDVAVDNEESAHTRAYAAANDEAARLGVRDNLHFHDWVPRSEMPHYYSTGVATLCIGSFPEAFGNVHVESMLCGVPAIVSRVAAQRTTVPDELVRKVDPGDVDAAADHLAEVIGRRERVGEDLMAYLRHRYSLATALRGYSDAILGCERDTGPVLTPQPPLSADTLLRIPPWAARLQGGYYNDYTGFCADPTLRSCLADIEGGVRVGNLMRAHGITEDHVARWTADGLVVAGPVAPGAPNRAGSADRDDGPEESESV